MDLQRWSAICVAGTSDNQIPAPGSRDGNQTRGTPEAVCGAALSKGMTLNAPISPMGLSWMEDFMIPFLEKIQLNAGPMKGLLFAAVLLEVGGVLQHGAVIAREYGKPCVAGIDGLMTKLNDGQRVEVDGTAGVIRLLS